ncbi:unnamed protein product [Cyprideis torosa]|uniref:Uncharacterized protein n=1 Tax=Cyprideis torosa TaxID=163714 RepID=A0A7R8WL04_9CRUS|nr:unnamed protein product [Cyprideis torosa]CAG0903815.1 unnamed protein product [Cyprideis torosa]
MADDVGNHVTSACEDDENDEKYQGGKEKPKKHDSGAADLEKVTDYEEEKEISSQDINSAMSLIGQKRQQENLQRMARERELAKVAIRKEDVQLIMDEYEIPRTKAERTLRENHGDLHAALTALLN